MPIASSRLPESLSSAHRFLPTSRLTYLGAGNGDLNLAAGGGHDGSELLANAGEEAQSVVLGESVEEVLDGLVVGTDLLAELLDDGGLVGDGQGRGVKDSSELGVLLEESAKLGESIGRGVEGGGLGGGSVLSRGKKELNTMSVSGT